MKDEDGNVVLEQSSNGKVWIRNEIKIGASTSTVSIGYLDKYRIAKDQNNNDWESHEVINANDKFIVYEDGSMKATDGEFTGIIYATGGKIGNMDISSLVGGIYEVVISSADGPFFKNGQGTKTLIAQLYNGSTEITEGLSYQWYRFSEPIIGATNRELVVSAEDLNEATDSATYSCEIEYNENKEVE